MMQSATCGGPSPCNRSCPSLQAAIGRPPPQWHNVRVLDSLRNGCMSWTRGTLLLLLLLGGHVLLVNEVGHLAKHDGGVAVKERDAGEALAVLEGVDDEGLLRLEDDLGHLVRLERVRALHLFAASLLADLEVEAGCP